MVIYNVLPKKEYERIFICNTVKEIWKALLITHQGLKTAGYKVSTAGSGLLLLVKKLMLLEKGSKLLEDKLELEELIDDEEQDESKTKPEKKTVVPTIPKVDVARPKQQEKPVRKIVRYAKMYRSQKPRGNQRNCHNQKSQQLGSDFVMNNKASFVCGRFDHQKKDYGKRIIKPVWKNTRRVNDHYSTRMTYSNPRRNMIPQAVLMRSRIKAVNTAKPKDAHNVVKRNRFNTVKASACWVWMPKNRVIDHVSKYNNASGTLKRFDYIDA
ncbi:hypothetical protein Tco_0145641 [Tanacetum coccineum]